MLGEKLDVLRMEEFEEMFGHMLSKESGDISVEGFRGEFRDRLRKMFREKLSEVWSDMIKRLFIGCPLEEFGEVSVKELEEVLKEKLGKAR